MSPMRPERPRPSTAGQTGHILLLWCAEPVPEHKSCFSGLAVQLVVPGDEYLGLPNLVPKPYLPSETSLIFLYVCSVSLLQYGIKKKEEKEAEAAAAMEQASEGSLTRPKKAVPTGCGDEEEEESIVDTVMKFIPTPLMDMFNKK